MSGPRGVRPLVKRALRAALLAPLAFSQACGGGGGGGGGTPHFSCSGVVAAAANQVSMACPATSASPISISVVIGGPTAPDIYAIDFDLVFDPAVMLFQSPAVEGTFLNQASAPTTLQAASPPGDPGRVVVSLSRIGAVAGAQSSAAQTTVVTLVFASTGNAGSTSLGFENAKAVDSINATIATFTATPLTISYH